MDVYGDNVNIIPEEVPELLSYMDEMMPKKVNDGGAENDILDTVIDLDRFCQKRGRKEINERQISLYKKMNECLPRVWTREVEYDIMHFSFVYSYILLLPSGAEI